MRTLSKPFEDMWVSRRAASSLGVGTSDADGAIHPKTGRVLS